MYDHIEEQLGVLQVVFDLNQLELARTPHRLVVLEVALVEFTLVAEHVAHRLGVQHLKVMR